MRVLSVGTRVERDAEGKAIEATTAALEVTPEEAERLAVAVNQGTIQLVLRGYGDPDSVGRRARTRPTSCRSSAARRSGPPSPPRPAPRRSAPRRGPPLRRPSCGAAAEARLADRHRLPRRRRAAAEVREAADQKATPQR